MLVSAAEVVTANAAMQGEGVSLALGAQLGVLPRSRGARAQARVWGQTLNPRPRRSLTQMLVPIPVQRQTHSVRGAEVVVRRVALGLAGGDRLLSVTCSRSWLIAPLVNTVLVSS